MLNTCWIIQNIQQLNQLQHEIAQKIALWKDSRGIKSWCLWICNKKHWQCACDHWKHIAANRGQYRGEFATSKMPRIRVVCVIAFVRNFLDLGCRILMSIIRWFYAYNPGDDWQFLKKLQNFQQVSRYAIIFIHLWTVIGRSKLMNHHLLYKAEFISNIFILALQ